MNLSLHTYWKEISLTLKIAIPIVLSQIGMVIVNLADNVMIGRLGKDFLAAASLSNGIFYVLMVFGYGIVIAISPLVSASFERGDKIDTAKTLSNALVFNFLLGIVLMIVCLGSVELLPYFNQPPEVIEMSKPFLRILSYSFVPVSLVWTLKQFCESTNTPKIATIAIVSGNIVNIVLNYMWIFGNWGAPKLGMEGAALGTLVSRIAMLIVIIWLIYQSKTYHPFLVQIFKNRVDFQRIKKLFFLGMASGFQFLFEVSAFSFTSIMAGWIDTTSMAAHQIALNLASLTYIIASGLGTTTTIRVGNQMGLQNYTRLNTIVKTNSFLIGMFMFLCVLFFYLFRFSLPQFYVSEPEVIHLAASILGVAALFQLSDGLQVIFIGATRGMQDLFIPTLITFLSYWALGIPLGYWFGFTLKSGVWGLWMGLLCGLSFAALFLYLRYRLYLKKLKYNYGIT